MKTVIAIQFGNVYQRKADGYTLVSRVYSNPSYLWATTVNESAPGLPRSRAGSLGVADPLLEGYVWAAQASEFWLGLVDGDYRLTIRCYDSQQGMGLSASWPTA